MDADTISAEKLVWEQIHALDIACEAMECDPEMADTAAFCAHYGVAPLDSANLILVASKKKNPRRYAACVVLADSRLDVNHTVCGLMGIKRASFASAAETRQLTGQLIGGVSVFGLPANLPIYIDARVMARERVVVGGGSRRCKIRLAPGEFNKLPNARVITGLSQLREST